ncbi:MAG: energy-coupling factor transporter transmembrane protein EcfT [Candidatus Omnitrophica bacterium]|nr:energy-coupling factor transporter transmembrane protein EcfT [Candidatus Omnitrophota bacterium]
MKSMALFSPRQKIILILASALYAISTDNPHLMGGYFIFMVALFLTAGVGGRKKQVWLAAIVLTLWGTIFSQSLFYAKMPRTILFSLISKDTLFIGAFTGGLNFYKEGIEYGFIQAMRFGITLTCGLLVCFTTESKDILRAAIRLKVPYSLSFMVSIGLRFIPLIVAETKTVISAQRMRGFSPMQSGLIKPVKTARTVLLPILVNSIRRSSMLSLSVESRHFGRKQAFYLPREKKENIFINIALFCLGLLIITMGIIKMLYFLYLSSFLYFPELRAIYSLAEKYI